MGVRSWNSSTSGGFLNQLYFVGDDLISNQVGDGTSNVWQNVTDSLVGLPLVLPFRYVIRVQWLAQFQVTGSLNNQGFFDSNPVRWKRGFVTPSLGIYAIDTQPLQYDNQCTQTYSFTWANAQPQPSFGPLQTLPNLGQTDEIVSDGFAIPALGSGNLATINQSYTSTSKKATLIRWQIVNSSYNVGIVYAGVLLALGNSNVTNRVLVQV